jgi:hypothetical protein
MYGYNVHLREGRQHQHIKFTVTPRFSVGLINPNDTVNSVDFGQMTVNLGHHLENITDNH